MTPACQQKSFCLGNRQIGPGLPTYIIAELSANHANHFDRAVETIRAAKASGADAIKLQTYTADTLTINCDNPHFRIDSGTLWDGRTLYDLYTEASMPWEWQPELKRIANELGMDLFSTPFDATAVDFLEQMDVPAHKVASFEVVDVPLLQKIGETQKPVIMSTGMATLAEIDLAVETLRQAGCGSLALLKCTSAYPAPPESMNLRTIPHLANCFGTVAGLSDHTLGIAAPVTAVALGACIIEKHMTLDRDQPGPDSAFSLEPTEFRAMVDAVRMAEKAMGDVVYGTGPHESSSRGFRRSLFVVRDVAAGETIGDDAIRSIRPGGGLNPQFLPEVVGRTAKCDLKRGTPLEWRHVA